MTAGRLFCFGFGYSAAALARALRPAGWTIAGTATTEDKVARLRTEGIDAFLFRRDHPLADPRVAQLVLLAHALAADNHEALCACHRIPTR